MSETPEDLKYAKTHEWVRVEEDGTLTIGISDHAQSLLGDLVFVDLPEKGREVTFGEECAVVESVKAASDIYSPVSGDIIAVNELLTDEPEQVNQSPYDSGWLFKVRPNEGEDGLSELLSADEYAEMLEEDE